MTRLVRLGEIFTAKGWEIDEDFENGSFRRYMRTLDEIDQMDQDFFLDLTARFMLIESSQYSSLIKQAIASLSSAYTSTLFDIIPCKSKAAYGSIKSCDYVFYEFKGSHVSNCKEKGNNRFRVHDNIQEWVNSLKAKPSKIPNLRIILVDDFVGTGNTVIEAFNSLQEDLPSLKTTQISVLCIYAMRDGVKNVNDFGIQLFSAIMGSKGIADYYTNPQLEEAIIHMSNIESKIKGLDPNYKFGYHQSESLVSLIRCPNNTFPIYWKIKNTSPYER